jgi:pyruvate dehydrogenase (quinone)
VTIPLDVQERKLEGNYSGHKVPGYTSDCFVTSAFLPDRGWLEQAAAIINGGNKVVILVGQRALNAGEKVRTIAEKLGCKDDPLQLNSQS